MISQNYFQKDRPIVLYLHGNTGSRAREHRIELYKVLQNLNYHIICFDYRGYADSSPIVPSKTGVVEDTLKVYDYVKSHAKNSPIIGNYTYQSVMDRKLSLSIIIFLS